MATTTTVKIHEQNLEKQIEKHMNGCMWGFFNIFDRSNRLYPKRLPSPPVCDSASEAVSSTGSPALSREFEKPKQLEVKSPPAPEKNFSPVTKNSSPTSPWKFAREAPRLSLDSRAITDAKGGLRPREIRVNTTSNSRNSATCDEERRSPSVIARLMGLEPLPSSVCSSGSSCEPEKKSELRRSASESRSREYNPFVDTPSSFLCPARNDTVHRKLDHPVINGAKKGINQNNNNNSKMSNNQRRLMLEKKSYYDTTDFFPAEVPVKQHHQAISIYGEIERRLRTRGLDEPSKDLETLKHILEALQLKGLLHSSTSTSTTKPVHDRRFSVQEESPIMLMKPTNRRRNNNCSSAEPALSPRRERLARSVARSPGRGDNRSSSPTLRRKNSPVNTHSPVQSPRLTRRSEQTVSRSPRNRRPTTEDELSTSSFSTSSFPDNERWRIDEYKEGRNILERCDKLLHNIAEITANSSSNSNSAELQQPSPVSVLDSSFYKEDESSPSPVKKRTLDFKDQGVIELEDGPWSPSLSTQLLKLDIDINSLDDPEFSYVAEVIRASIYRPDDQNLFYLLENQSSIRCIVRDKSKVSTLQRKLIFDTTTEILDRNRQLPPWKAVSNPEKRPLLDHIWSEFQTIRERVPSEDVLEVICGVLKKDLSRDSITGWTDFPTEMSEAILDIERLIFKDLINESIQDLATLAKKIEEVPTLCRKLVF